MSRCAPFHSYRELAAQHPTGRTRWRRRFLRSDVLQIEIKSPVRLYPAAPPPPDRPYDVWERGSYTFWRDARPTDELRASKRRSR